MNGVLVIDKPAGWTSHDAVAKVKRTLGAKKVGHLGTLDPIATGVLVLVVNGATRFASVLDVGGKEYLSTLRLGAETDTYDSEGSVVSTEDYSGLTDEDVRKAFDGFRGRIKQVPPMYSAIKSKGTPLYKLARKGVTIEREAREVEVAEIDVLRVAIPDVEFRALCSKGTYIRSICHDVGRLLGCGAHMTGLRRLACGRFGLDGAAGPQDSLETLSSRMIPLEKALDMVKEAQGAVKMASMQ